MQCEVGCSDVAWAVEVDLQWIPTVHQDIPAKGLGGFGSGWYWSSSQNSNNNNAWNQRFSDGNQDNNNKNNKNAVRAVRGFEQALGRCSPLPGRPGPFYLIPHTVTGDLYGFL